MIRIFAALELPDDVRDRLAMLAGGVPGARWISPENMHITLRFVGEVDEPAFADVAAALSRVEAPAFDLAIEGVGNFAHGRKPTMLWAGVAKNPALDLLQGRVDQAVTGTHLPPDAWRFTPHVTLARLKGSPPGRVQQFIADHSLLRLPPFRVESFTLFSSFLGHAGAIYRAEATYELLPQ